MKFVVPLRPHTWSMDLTRRLAAVAMLSLSVGCMGAIQGDVPPSPDDVQPVAPPPHPAALPTGSMPTEPTPPVTQVPGPAAVVVPPPLPRILRLTHLQYNNTVSALFGKALAPADAFPPDPLVGTFPNDNRGLSLSAELIQSYQRAAEEIAESVTAGTAFAALFPCSAGDATCLATFVSGFGERALRRPLLAREKQAYQTLFGQGPDLFASGNALRDGVRAVVETLLQQPDFLFRVETAAHQDGLVIPLDDYAMASRLSYALWNSLPDEQLFAAARTSKLHTREDLIIQIDRMLADDRGIRTLIDFHDQWLEAQNYRDLVKDSHLFPGWGTDQGIAAGDELHAFVDSVARSGGGLTALLTAPYTFVDRRLGSLYDHPELTATSPARLDLPAASRGGLFSQVGFLAFHASGEATSPIKRGVFLHRRLFCTALPSPPANVDMSTPALSSTIRTRRQQVTAQTSGPNCRGCHEIINPPGFAFEEYSAVGKLQTRDNGEAIDSSGTMSLDGQQIAFAGASDLMRASLASPQVRTCYVAHWVKFLFGRDVDPVDDAMIARVASGAASSSLTTIVRDLLASDTFRVRAPEDTK